MSANYFSSTFVLLIAFTFIVSLKKSGHLVHFFQTGTPIHLLHGSCLISLAWPPRIVRKGKVVCTVSSKSFLTIFFFVIKAVLGQKV